MGLCEYTESQLFLSLIVGTTDFIFSERDFDNIFVSKLKEEIRLQIFDIPLVSIFLSVNVITAGLCEVLKTFYEMFIS